MEIERKFKTVLDCAFKVHTALGPGLLESAYEECLLHEILKTGLKAHKQKPLPLVYEDVKLNVGYRVDIFVDEQTIVEFKSIDAMADIHLAQILTYMKLCNSELGLLVNFNVRHLKDGIKRVIL